MINKIDFLAKLKVKMVFTFANGFWHYEKRLTK